MHKKMADRGRTEQREQWEGSSKLDRVGLAQDPQE